MHTLDPCGWSKGKRGAIIPSTGKTRITIRIDDDILEWFRVQVHNAGGGNYQTLMNEALRRFIDSDEGDMEDLLRRVIREELRRTQRRSARSSI